MVSVTWSQAGIDIMEDEVVSRPYEIISEIFW